MSEHDRDEGGRCPEGTGSVGDGDAGADAPAPAPQKGPTGLGRREFLRTAGAGAGLLLAGGAGAAAAETPRSPSAPPRGAPALSKQIPDVVVVGAGAFGGWTAYYLQEMGARVVMVDKYGPANSRATSGGETRGVRSAYGGRPVAELWMRWANESIARWKRFDEEWGERYLPRMFFSTGDLILRERTEPLLDESMRIWDDMGVPYEVLDGDEVRYRWPVIGNTENVGIAVHEVNAGVVRARRAMEAVATVFMHGGGEIVVAEAMKPAGAGRVGEIDITPGERLQGGTFVYALGPWFGKVFPELMANKLRIPIGHTFYFGTPPGSNAYEWPHLPSYNVPGCTGWPALPPDNRGFRVRTGGRPPQDPDESVRWVDDEYFDRPLQILETWFPELLRQPVLETRACHYESPIGRNFIIDRHPDHENVWLTGGGAAEAFKQGPVLGEYIAARVLGRDLEPDLAEGFRLPEEEYDEVG